jgi:DNA-nicking Smr family endonuclease
MQSEKLEGVLVIFGHGRKMGKSGILQGKNRVSL